MSKKQDLHFNSVMKEHYMTGHFASSHFSITHVDTTLYYDKGTNQITVLLTAENWTGGGGENQTAVIIYWLPT